MDILIKVLLHVAKIVAKFAKVLYKLGILNEDSISAVGSFISDQTGGEGIDLSAITNGLGL